MASGYLTVARFAGTRLRLHFTLPIGALVVSGGKFAPVTWAAFAFLIIVHELGHAFLVRRYRLDVDSIDLHALGGVCRWSGYASELQRAKIAWGGVLAQGVVLLIADRLLKFFPALGQSPLASEVFQVLLVANLVIIGLNLLPIAPFDGAEAWRIFRWDRVVRWPRQLWLRIRFLVVKRKLDRLKRTTLN
jgi:Zn-dependent protease